MSDPFSLERQPGSRPPTDLAPASPDFFEIQVAHHPVPIRIEYAAIRELQRQLAGEGESVGLLVGFSTPGALSIQHCEVLAVSPGATGDPKLLVGAFRQALAARSQTQIADAPQLLGCFRTQVGGWPGMKEADLGMVKRAFPGSDTFFVLIRTTSHRPWLATLYALDAKTTTTSVEPALEFPFDEYLLRKGYLTDLVETPESVDLQEKPKKSKTPWIIAAVAFAILLAASTAAYKLKWFHSPEQPDVVVKNVPAPALNLKVNRSGKDFEVSWDRLSDAVQHSTGGMLTITDGALTRPVALNSSQLREGRILYTPLFEELNFRLEVVTPDAGTSAESVQVLAWSGKQPADVLTVAPPIPVATTPARVVPTPANAAPPSPKPVAPVAKSAPAPLVNNPKQPPAGKQTQPAKPTSSPATVAVIQPPPPITAPPTPTRAPETPRPAVIPERPVVSQPVQQLPANTPPSQAPPAPAPKPEPAPVTVAPSTPPPAIAPTVVSGATSTPVSATPAPSARIAPPVPTQRIAAIIPGNIPKVAVGVARVITVRVMVDSAGSVQSAEVTASNPKGAFGETVMKSAALDAAKKWKFRPGQVDGKNVAAEYSIEFKF